MTDRDTTKSQADAIYHLAMLVEALDSAFISTWQSTAAWQTQLDAARDFLARNAIQETEQ